MEEKDKKRAPMPPPNATPEEIGEFWDNHSLADYWDETNEADFQVNLKPKHNRVPVEREVPDQTNTPAAKPDVSVSEDNLISNMSDETKPDQLPTTEDALSTLLGVVTDLVSTLTLPASIGRNASKAFGQLCSALVDVPVEALKRRSAEKRAESEARIKIIEENAAQISGQMKVPPEYAWRAGNKFAEKIIREQINLDKISIIAANELKKEAFDSSTAQSADSSEEKTISDDFLNSFEEEVRHKSSEDMQILFGRILAGEIRKPGTYSIRTVKILGQLDQNVAMLFKRLCSLCVVHGDPAGKEIFDARVPTLDGNPGSNVLRKYGLSYEKLNILNEYGLIISSYDSWYEYNLLTITDQPPFTLPLWHQGRYWGLFALPEWDKSRRQFRLSGVALSHAGCELFRLVDPDSMEDYTEDLKKFLAGQHLQIREINIQNGNIIF